MGQTVGLYFHIPFCQKKCDYCDFYSVPDGDERAKQTYAKALSAHLTETAPALTRHTVDTVYFGGGTPPVLGFKPLHALMDLIRRRLPLAAGAEITLEANPGTVDGKLLAKLRRAGFNRLSLGVQSLDDDTLALLGRVHNARQARAAFDEARAAGFDNIGVDLLYGLPGQTTQEWRATLLETVAWAPEHISCYGLKLEEGTPLWRDRADYVFPDDDTQADQYLAAVAALEENGYLQYEISNFAKPGRVSRHNLKYWTLAPYIGLGPSACSDFGGRRWSYVRDFTGYVRGVLDGGDILRELEEIPIEARAAEYLMLRLRTADGVSGNEYVRLYKQSFEPIERALEAQAARGLARSEGDRWRLTPQGFLLSNRIIADVLDARSEGM
ncbi:MAG: radical SAM family heme chaperone HemW [Oscillospiraceae bacterium]|jgi:oxygen-independent coproporphyrinogen-3 oxidase|nr:radical SAM family heme chaperone HemW [Oscillospiraceae bacterium]